MLTPVPVHAHDQTLLVLHAHLVVDVLLDAAPEEALQEEEGRGFLSVAFSRAKKTPYNGLALTLHPSQACTP